MAKKTKQAGQKKPDLWQINLAIGAIMPNGKPWNDETATQLADFFEDLGAALSIRMDDESHEWFIEIISETEPDRVTCNARLGLYQMVIERPVENIKISFEKLPDIDWLAHVHQQFLPRAVGNFLIHGSHIKGEELQQALKQTKTTIPLEINAAIAFGSGEHPTTQGCLQALYDLLKAGEKPDSILDLGCGSGILAIAAALVLESGTIIASDFDADSVAMTEEHARMNNVQDRIKAYQATGFDHKSLKNAAPYDLIFANILAKPLIDLAKDMAEAVGQGGYVILSGMLSEQSDGVGKAYAANNFKQTGKYSINGWDTLIVQRD